MGIFDPPTPQEIDVLHANATPEDNWIGYVAIVAMILANGELGGKPSLVRPIVLQGNSCRALQVIELANTLHLQCCIPSRTEEEFMGETLPAKDAQSLTIFVTRNAGLIAEYKRRVAVLQKRENEIA